VIVDSSVFVSILREEAEEDHYRRLISSAESARLSAASYLEIGIVIDKPRDPSATRSVDDFIAQSGITIEPVTERQARIAREAYRDFGRGSGHPARLNFGDCFAYALARDLGEPLLFKGDDFRHTDVRSAID
jgi:ribonuclease VapC